MTALDIIVLLLIGGGAIFGFLRGFVMETLSLIAWVLAIFAIRMLHAPVTEWLAKPVGTQSGAAVLARSEEHTSELQSLMRTSYAVFCLKKKKVDTQNHVITNNNIT